MNDEELERLAAAMKDMKPTDKARARGMDAAMAAYDAAFAADTGQEAGEEVRQEAGQGFGQGSVKAKSETVQGLDRGTRPTGHTTRIKRAETLRSDKMTSLRHKFSFNPKAVMMVGSCAAALTFALVIMPFNGDLYPAGDAKGEFETIATEIGGVETNTDVEWNETLVADTKQIVPDAGSRIGLKDKSTLDQAAAQFSETNEAESPSTTADGISSIEDVLQKARSDSSTAGAENAQGLTVNRLFRRMGKKPMTGHTSEEIHGYVENPTAHDQFENYKPNETSTVQTSPVSTFSVDVDTASYSFLRASLRRGQLPPPASIRLEEMINYFPYDYEAPDTAEEPFKANVTIAPTPWNADTKLMHIGIKGYVPTIDEKPRSNIVFLIDTSGSMRASNKLPLLIESFKMLLGTLDEEDTVSIVTYAGAAGTVLEPTPANETGTIKAALNRLHAGGGTAGATGLELAYQKASDNFDDEGINRVILATDGDFNVGFSSPDAMKRFVTHKRKSGIFLSVLGFGSGNYNDALMQALAQNGNGVAAYIDSLSEAKKVLADEAGSALITIAKDVKIQVEFNPETVSEYRLIGYETRVLRREDFNNDKVDAGEINSGHSVTAIYELTPVGSPAQSVDNLRYARENPMNLASGSDEYAFIKIRHKLPSSDTSTLQTFPIGPDQDVSFIGASDDMRFASAVAAAGQKLRGDSQLSDYSFDDVIELAIGGQGDDKNGYRAEFIELMRTAKQLEK